MPKVDGLADLLREAVKSIHMRYLYSLLSITYRQLFAQDLSCGDLRESSAWSKLAQFLMQSAKWLPGHNMSERFI